MKTLILYVITYCIIITSSSVDTNAATPYTREDFRQTKLTPQQRLMTACEDNKMATAKSILKLSSTEIDLNNMQLYSELNQTYLHIVCSLIPFPKEFALLLIDYGASIEVTDLMGMTPIDYLDLKKDKTALRERFSSLQKS
jgi:hypothetical protein